MVIKLKLINNDILNCYNNFKFDKPIKVFGNLPYNISTKILISFIKIRKFLKKFFKKFIFIFQKEVADRIISKRKYKKLWKIINFNFLEN